jgi:SHS2 domain-containing protein
VTSDSIPQPFEVLEHTADVGLRVYGKTLAELFANAGLGLMTLAGEARKVPPREHAALSATAPDVEQLLVNWLSEILYRMDAEGWIFSRFQVDQCEPMRIEGHGWGERREAASRTRSVAVKAVTYHQLSVREAEHGWEATVYFDI